jgi:histidinol-phosphate/aromatic aminotransferase/cobyric acid decarboxylase-like protein
MALQDPEYYASRYAETQVLREQLTVDLQQLGWQVIAGNANFLLCHLPESGPTADALIRHCQQHGLFLRNAGSMGSGLGERTIRIAVKDADTNARMLHIISPIFSCR